MALSGPQWTTAYGIDHFKRVNDSFGHGVGDDVIEFVGGTIQTQVRATDKVARFGGEEFVVLLRETDLSHGTMLAEQIREQIATFIDRGTRRLGGTCYGLNWSRQREGG